MISEKMGIKGFIKNSLVDWDGKISSVIFLPGCTFRCPWCYARDLVIEYEKMPTVNFEEIKTYLLSNKKFIDGVVITGGEPTLHQDLPELCKKIKDLGFPVKLDTNGTNPIMLRELMEKKLIDYIAMDVKAPLEEEYYNKINGGRNLLDEVKESIDFIMHCGIDYEFRTTVVLGLHDEKAVEKIGSFINGAKKWAIQNFMVPREKNKLIDESYYKHQVFSEEEVKRLFEIAKKYVKKAVLRV